MHDNLTSPQFISGRNDLTHDAMREVVIVPSRGWSMPDLHEVWEQRELLYFLIWRDVKVRYKQTLLGVAWVVLKPLTTMIVFSVIFGRLLGVPSNGVPYSVFSFSALLIWTYFSTGVVQASSSLVGNANLISKVYFPRLMLPMSGIAAAIIDFLVGFVVLLVIMLNEGLVPSIHILATPLFLLLTSVTALGTGLWLSALGVKYRDVSHSVPFLIQFWLFVTPVFYSGRLVPQSWRLLYALNPMVGIVEGFRWALLGTSPEWADLLLVSSMVALTLLISGLFYFRRMEREFADIV